MPLDQDVDWDRAALSAGNATPAWRRISATRRDAGAPLLARADGIDWADLADWPGRREGTGLGAPAGSGAGEERDARLGGRRERLPVGSVDTTLGAEPASRRRAIPDRRVALGVIGPAGPAYRDPLGLVDDSRGGVRSARERALPRPSFLAGVVAVCGAGLLAGLGLFGGAALAKPQPVRPAAQVVTESTSATGHPAHHGAKRLGPLAHQRPGSQHPASGPYAKHAAKRRTPVRRSVPGRSPATSSVPTGTGAPSRR